MSDQQGGATPGNNVTPIGARLADARPTARRHAKGFLPEGCPIECLGGDGRQFFYVNTIGQMVMIPAERHSKNVLMALFAGHDDWLTEHFWQRIIEESGQKVGWKHEKVASAMFAESQATNRTFRPNEDTVRGLGAWRGADGDLVLHLGRQVWAGGRMQRVGRVGDFIYPLEVARAEPSTTAQPGGADGPGAELLRLLEQWRWTEHQLAPVLMLGWAMHCYLGGALKWRAHLWLHAPRGAGKSTLLKLLSLLLGAPNGAHYFADATAAGVRAVQGTFSALPVILDEQEPAEDNRKLNEVLNLLLPASSGGRAARGTADNGSVTQTIRFPFIGASIVKPSFSGGQTSRITVLDMQPLPLDQPEPNLTDGMMLELGRRLHRRAVDSWKRLEHVQAAFKVAMAERRTDQRTRDQFSIMLAMAWCALHDEAPDADHLEEWSELTLALTASDRAEDRPEHFRCIEHLAAQIIRTGKGADTAPVVELLAIASFRQRRTNAETGDREPTRPEDARAAQQALARVGLKFHAISDDHGRPLRQSWYDLDAGRTALGHAAGDGPALGYLAVANSHPELNRLFQGTRWQGRSGAVGAWKDVLRSTPGHALPPDGIRFGARTARCVMVPVDEVFGTATEAGE